MSWQPYNDYKVSWEYVSGDRFVEFNGLYYSIDKNCESSSEKIGTYKCTIKADDGTLINSFNITFNQNGVCESCPCEDYGYRVTSCFNDTVNVPLCGGNGTFNGFSVEKMCVNPIEKDIETYNRWKIGDITFVNDSGDNFVTFNGNRWNVEDENCNEQRQGSYEVSVLDEDDNFITDCTVTFTQNAPCPQCPCTSYEYRVDRCFDDEITLYACVQQPAQLSGLVIKRRCTYPQSETWEDYDSYIIGVPTLISGEDIVVFSDGNKFYAASGDNCTTSAKTASYSIPFSSDNGLISSCTVNFTQEAACPNCGCLEYSYDVTVNNVTVESCGGNGYLRARQFPPRSGVFSVQRTCVSPQGHSSFYTNYEISSIIGNGFVTFDGNSAYTVDKNCTEDDKECTYEMALFDKDENYSTEIGTYHVTFSQSADCDDCQCENYVYSGIGSFDSVTIEPCGSSGTLSGMTIYRRCTGPMVTDFVIYNDWKVSGETDEFATFNGKEWSVGQNCGEPREKTYELLILDENDADTDIRTSVKFTQDNGCSECPCEYEYRIESCFVSAVTVDACVKTRQEPLEGLVVQRKCKNTENWEDYEDYIIGTPSRIGGEPFFLTFTEDNKAYNANENCFSNSIGAVYSFPILNDANEHISACTITFIQQPCSCEDIAQKHTTVLKCTFEDSGGTNVLIGSATTHCGSISATSDSEMIDNLITQKDGDDYKFYVSVNERQDTTKPRSAGITFSYRNSDNEVSGCSTPLYIEQNGSYCECSKLPKIEVEDRYYLKWRDNEPQWFGTESMMRSQDVYKSISACTSIFLTDDDPTIIDSTLQAKYSWKFFVQARWKDNISWSARTKTITAFTVSDAVIDERNVLIGGDVCDEKEITIVQSGAPTCDCESYFYIYGPNALTHTDNSFTTNEFNGTVWYRHNCYEYYVDTDGEFFKFDIDTSETDSWLKLEFDGEIAFTTGSHPYHVGTIKYYFLDATSSTRTTTFKLLFDSPNGVCETEIFVTQEPKEITVCDCSSVKAYSKSLGGKSYNTFDAVEFYPIGTNCTLGGMSVNFVGDCDWINSLRIVPNGDRYKLYLDGVEQNPSTTETRQCKVSWQTDGIGSVGACNGEIEINQKPFIECACNKLTVVDDTIETARTFDYSDQDQTRVIGSIGFDYESDYGDCGIPMFKTNNTQQRYFEIVEPINLIDDGNGHVRGEIAVTVHPYHEIGHQDVSFNIFLNGCDQSNRRWNKIIPLIINPKP